MSVVIQPKPTTKKPEFSPPGQFAPLPGQVQRAYRILHETLPVISSHDEAVNHLYYVDSNNDLTRLHSIAAALYILREAEK